MCFALKKKLWPETGTANLKSPSPTNKPSNLASPHTMFLFLLPLFSPAQSTTPQSSHLTRTYLRLSSGKIFLPNSRFACFLQTLPNPTLSAPSPTALLQSKFLQSKSQMSQALESLPLAALSHKTSSTDLFSLFISPSQHGI